MPSFEVIPFLTIKNLCKSYPERSRSGWRTVMRPILTDISFTMHRGEILGLLGESGSGKSTLARCILGLETPDSGMMLFEGQSASSWRKANVGRCSVVFQDYVTSVNPGFRVKDIIAEGLRPSSRGRQQVQLDVEDIMERVQLSARLADSLPHELSGGQLQRVCIARALASEPYLIIFDEAISALDVSIQAQILELLRAVKKDMTYLFITHDIQVATLICDRLILLRNGRMDETIVCTKMKWKASPYLRELIDSTLIFSSKFSETPTSWEPPL